MARLPVPGNDDNAWGTILNDFLEVEHNADGTLKVRSDDTFAPQTRLIATGTGLSGGGDLAANRTLSVIDDTTTQRVEVGANGATAGARKHINFIAGNAIAVQAADNTVDNTVDVTIDSSAAPLSTFGQQQLATQRTAALLPWANGLANRHYNRCNLVCIGDSITEGQGATQADRRWLARLRNNLRTHYRTTGVNDGGRGFLGAAGTGEISFVWPATITGSPAQASTLGPKCQFVQLNGGGQSITYALTGNAVDIMWTQVPFGGTFSWSVDGGGSTNVSTNGGAIIDGQLTHIDMGAPGSHTLTISWVSGSANIAGVIEFSGDYTAGIQVHDAGHYGWQTSNWAATTTGGAAGPANAIAQLSPSLIIITLGVNDQFSAVPPATFQTNITTIIAQLRAAQSQPYPAIVLNMLPPRVNQSTYTYPWAQYVDAAWDIAATDTGGPDGSSIVSVMDFTLGPRMLGADDDPYGGWPPGDEVHPSDKGHSLIADAITRFLTQSF